MLVLLAWIAAGCSSDSASARASDTHRADAPKKTGASVDLVGRPYHPGPLAAFGSVHGTIKTSGQPLADSVTGVGKSCAGKPLPAAGVSKGAPPVVVWVKDVATGKPYPIEKRADLSIDNCVLDPAVQAVVVGTTFNVFNDDKEIHRLVFTRAGTNDTLTVMPFFNSGQVVASERLSKAPQVVDVQCARHSWMHGYIAVFDNPYFAVTDEKGGFSIDSLPPGRYTVLAWHQGMADPSSQVVQVAANGSAAVNLTIP